MALEKQRSSGTVGGEVGWTGGMNSCMVTKIMKIPEIPCRGNHQVVM